jgi:hypothetical protein
MQLFFILISAFLQGISDPLIRKATQGIENIEAHNFISKKLIEIKFLFTNFKVNILVLICSDLVKKKRILS